MKRFFVFFIMLGFHIIVAAQKNELKEKTLLEITCFIENSYEFLGKTDSAILLAGRPGSIKGGDKWETTITDTHEKNEMNAGKAITIGTGCGALLLTVSAKTNLVNTLTFIPHKKAKIDGEDIRNFFKDRYSFDKNESVIKTIVR